MRCNHQRWIEEGGSWQSVLGNSFKLLAMVSDAQVAKQISDLMMEMFCRLCDSLDKAEEACPAEELAAYRKGCARVAGAIVLDVLEPLYKKHPELKPANWDEDPPQLTKR